VAESPPTVLSLVPHRDGALFLQRVESWGQGQIVCIAVVPKDSAFVREGRAPAFLGLELGAQSAAALRGLERAAAADPPQSRPGYLVGVRDARFACASLPAGRELRVFVRTSGGAGPLSVHEVRVEDQGVECLVAQLSTYGA
jgi:predicted hotdog family 3-hydroxylacyl-ACP dehydratase